MRRAKLSVAPKASPAGNWISRGIPADSPAAPRAGCWFQTNPRGTSHDEPHWRIESSRAPDDDAGPVLDRSAGVPRAGQPDRGAPGSLVQRLHGRDAVADAPGFPDGEPHHVSVVGLG